MNKVKVSAQRGTDPPVEVDFEVAENLSELTEQFGEDVVFSHGKRSIIIALQGYMRSIMDSGKEAGKSPSDIALEVSSAVVGWKPSQKKAPKSTSEKARDILSRLSPAERQALLKEYRTAKNTGAQAEA
jgi:hypothetical protein